MANRRFLSRMSGVARERRGHSPRRLTTVLLSSAGVIGTTVSFLAAGAGGTAAAVAPVITHAPRVVTGNPHGNYNTWAASNWSGYAETGSFTGVSGTWTVPSVAPSSSATYSSLWIGVDGFNNNSLIQTGTEEDYYNGSAHYNAWWEILPAAETAIPSSSISVTPGDRMSASIYETAQTANTGGRWFHGGSQHLWVITIKDTTTGKSFTTSQAYGGSGSSAEWVVEAPQVGGRIAKLANYSFSGAGIGSTVGDFDNAGILSHSIVSTTTSPAPTYAGAALNYNNDAGVMIQNNVQVSTPSTPDGVGTAFNAYYGNPTNPAAPQG